MQRYPETEAKLAALEAESNQPKVQSNAARLLELHAAMTPVREEIERMYARWAELEALVKAL